MSTLFNGRIINVGIAQFRTAEAPDALNTTLGSCVGIVLYNPRKRHGGIAHILLAKQPGGRIVNRAKYANTAIPELCRELGRSGSPVDEYRARIFGGASMFGDGSDTFIQRIGQENVAATRQALAEQGVTVIAEDVGGTVGRSITLFLDDGRVLLRKNGKEKYIYKV
ncbi:MAG: chemotaxis protein CheD [Leptospiraceae bacterium]|nr:chemotaxis protein CheD [Leptospiraceae bacterium]